MVDSTPPPLNVVNILNVIAYILNVLITYGIGVVGFLGFATNAELSEKYQTLITPAGWAFAIWAAIFTSQAIFVIVQLLPGYRGVPLVQEGVRFNYVGVCFAQMAWTIAFTYEIIWLSLVFMLTLLALLLTIVVSQYKVSKSNDDDNDTSSAIKDYWLLKFPFSIHAGWIVAASFVNLSVLLVDLGLSATVQKWAAIGSLIAVVAAAAVALSFPKPPEFVIPAVLVWATAAIWAELGNPNELITSTFTSQTINQIRIQAIGTSILILLFWAYFAVKTVRETRSDAASASTTAEEGRYLRDES